MALYQLIVVNTQGQPLLGLAVGPSPFGAYNAGDTFYMPNNTVLSIHRVAHRIYPSGPANEVTIATMLTLGPVAAEFAAEAWPEHST